MNKCTKPCSAIFLNEDFEDFPPLTVDLAPSIFISIRLVWTTRTALQHFSNINVFHRFSIQRAVEPKELLAELCI